MQGRAADCRAISCMVTWPCSPGWWLDAQWQATKCRRQAGGRAGQPSIAGKKQPAGAHLLALLLGLLGGRCHGAQRQRCRGWGAGKEHSYAWRRGLVWPLHSRAGEGSRLRRPSGTPATRQRQRRRAAATNAGGTRRGCGDPDQHGSSASAITERGAGWRPRDVCRRAGGPRRQRSTPSRLQIIYWGRHLPSSASPRHWSRMAMVPLLKLLAAPGGRLVQGNTSGESVEGVANDCTTCRGVQRPSSQARVHTRRRTAAVQFP